MFTTCTDSRPRARLNSSQGTSETWHPRVDYELLLSWMTNFSTKSGAARAAPAAPLLTALHWPLNCKIVLSSMRLGAAKVGLSCESNSKRGYSSNWKYTKCQVVSLLCASYWLLPFHSLIISAPIIVNLCLPTCVGTHEWLRNLEVSYNGLSATSGVLRLQVHVYEYVTNLPV